MEEQKIYSYMKRGIILQEPAREGAPRPLSPPAHEHRPSDGHPRHDSEGDRAQLSDRVAGRRSGQFAFFFFIFLAKPPAEPEK